MKNFFEKSVESRILANSVRWGEDRMMMMMISTNSASWGGDREFDYDDDDDGGEQYELGWR